MLSSTTFDPVRELQMIVAAEQDRRNRNRRHIELRANNLLIQNSDAKELMLGGPARTGKTFACLYKLHTLCQRWPGARMLIIRKTRESLNDSVLVTLERDVLGYDSPMVGSAQTASRKAYRYENGSVIIPAGLKQSGKDQKAKLLSSEYDIVYAPQAEEIMEDDWMKMSTRLSNYRTPYQQMLGDCNADSPNHWIWRRSTAGRLVLLPTTLHDNPRWWAIDPSYPEGGYWTDQGKDVYNTLSGLTGILHKRLFLGEWVAAEGIIYGDQWSDGPVDGNVTEAAEYIPDGGEVLWGGDDGYAGEYDPDLQYFKPNSHPRCFLMVQKRPDGTFNVFDESYEIGMLSDVHLAQLLGGVDESGNPLGSGSALPPSRVILDKSAAELRGRFHKRGIYTQGSPSDVEESIKNLMGFLAPDHNKVRRIRVHPRCKFLRFEMANYMRDPATQKPIKDVDHGPDALRYLAWAERYER